MSANLTFCMLRGSHLQDCDVHDVSIDNLVCTSAAKSKTDICEQAPAMQV